MRNCKYYSKLFSDYVDHTIDSTAQASLQKHVEHCPACKAKLQDLSNMKNALASLPQVKTSDSFDAVLHANLRREMRRAQPRKWRLPFFELNWRAPAYAFAAIFLVFLGAYLQRMNSPQLSIDPNSTVIAVRNASAGQMNYIDPGYMIFAGLDSVKNIVKIVNYPELDKARTMKSYNANFIVPEEDLLQDELPNLREAPENQPVLLQTSRQNMQQVEIVF
jgi:hypothetical protein